MQNTTIVMIPRFLGSCGTTPGAGVVRATAGVGVTVVGVAVAGGVVAVSLGVCVPSVCVSLGEGGGAGEVEVEFEFEVSVCCVGEVTGKLGITEETYTLPEPL
jgi:hypothetical protein